MSSPLSILCESSKYLIFPILSCRLSSVWLDEYKNYFYERVNDIAVNIGDISEECQKDLLINVITFVLFSILVSMMRFLKLSRKNFFPQAVSLRDSLSCRSFSWYLGQHVLLVSCRPSNRNLSCRKCLPRLAGARGEQHCRWFPEKPRNPALSGWRR